jgi:hypothetical protein
MKEEDDGSASTRRGTEVTAGVPGLGLSGLFVLMSALALPLARRGGLPRGRLITLFKLGVVMSVTVIASWQAMSKALAFINHDASSAHGHAPAGLVLGVWSWPAPVVVISASVMVLVIFAGEVLFQLVGTRLTPTPPPVTPIGADTPPSTVTHARTTEARRSQQPATSKEVTEESSRPGRSRIAN